MKPLSISEVRQRLPALVDGVVQTREPVLVTRFGNPVAMIVPVPPAAAGPERHPLRGRSIAVAGDFDTPMPELWDALRIAESGRSYAARRQPGRTKRSAP